MSGPLPIQYGVYRIYGDDDVPLYVGMSQNPLTRLRDHHRKDWWGYVARIEITLHGSAEEMVLVELEEIERLDPMYNTVASPRVQRMRALVKAHYAELLPSDAAEDERQAS